MKCASHIPVHCFRLAVFKKSLLRLFQEEHAQSLGVARVREFLRTEHKDEPITEREFAAAVHTMEEDNQIYMSDEFVFLI